MATTQRELVERILKAIRPDFWPPVWCKWGNPATPLPYKSDDKCYICGASYADHAIREEGSGLAGRLRYDVKHGAPSWIHWFMTREEAVMLGRINE